LKILDQYILRSYLVKLLSVFAISMLIFIVQTFWLFIDELAGKGLDLIIILKFLIYYSPKLIPLVVPLSILLASLMTFGTFAENYEFTAMKSTGISLQRAMVSLLILHFALGIGSFYFANHIIPYGELKSYNLRKNLAKLKPALAIREGIFNEVGNINIKVKNKYGPENKFLEDIIIHEYTPNNQNNIVIKSTSGELRSETTDSNLQLVLYDGNRYEEISEKNKKQGKYFPHTKIYFEEYVMNIDLSKFNNVDLNEEKYKTTFRMQKADQLKISIDSLERDFSSEKIIFSENFNKRSILATTLNMKKKPDLNDSIPQNVLDFIISDDDYKISQTIQNAMNEIKSSIATLTNKKLLYFFTQKRINLHRIELNDKFTLIFACVFLFLIGASLGAIIKKGGLGLPLVLSVVIFLTYHYIGLFAKNAAEDGSISPFIGAWVSTLVIAPSAIILTRRASTDKGFVSFDFVIRAYDKLVSLIRIKKGK
jgi:lipopolysaccharide export system permease protein